MNELHIAAIVEGHGEMEAVPVLVRRIVASFDAALNVTVLPWRVSASNLRRSGELERHIELAARQLGGKGGILILLDCDWDGGCPKVDGPALQEKAAGVRRDLPISVVLANREFESWFLAAAESLRGKRRLAEDLASPENPESIRGAKEWLSDRMPRTAPYAETTDQAALASLFDMEVARRNSRSFTKSHREIARLVQAVTEQESPLRDRLD